MVAVTLAFAAEAGPLGAQVVDTAGVRSDREIRQRYGYQLARLRAARANIDVAIAHALADSLAINARIVRDELRAARLRRLERGRPDSVQLFTDPTIMAAAGDSADLIPIAFFGREPFVCVYTSRAETRSEWVRVRLIPDSAIVELEDETTGVLCDRR